MSTIDMTVVSGSLQTMIDARLDAIDRALLGRVSRQERLNVVGEVEGRIHELLHDRCGTGVEPTRDDVLAVLSRLDPPEAYLSEGDDRDAPRVPRSHPQVPTAPAIVANLELGHLARYSGWLGLTSLAMGLLIPLSYAVAVALQNEYPLFISIFGGGAFMAIGGLISIGLAILSRLSNGWAIVGAAAGCISCLVGTGAFLFFLALILR